MAWAIVVGLVAGKIVGSSLLALRLRWGVRPAGMSTRTLFGVAALGGIGFTVSLFIAGLAYDDQALVAQAKIGIFVASAVAGVLGAALLAGTGTAAADADSGPVAADRR